MYKNLREFLKTLEQAGELKFIRQPVSPYLEISRFTDRESKSPNGGKALFFENVVYEGSEAKEKYEFPIVTNIFGSYRRICMALGVNHLDEPGERIKEYIHFNPPKNLKEALNVIHTAISLSKFFPRYV